ncbi:MAG: hypothetical protein Ct9H300mP12_11610 [Acidimicrobiales bacterium]|nr:MAG: hypothetical protein Ct9H300mP12_11610 [Acidimicrobiales bacterium]
MAASKALIRATQGATEEELWALQQPFLKTVWGSQDAKEGPRAFAEKRAPDGREPDRRSGSYSAPEANCRSPGRASPNSPSRITGASMTS